jgi:adenosylhomocysteine nucleosidase
VRIESRRGVAVVTAMGIESLGLSKALEAGPWHRRLRRGWHEGMLGQCPVVLATCGVGLKNAHRWAEVLLEEYEPRLVILTGASGGVGPHVELGDRVLAESVYRCRKRQVSARYPCDPELVSLAHEVAAVANLRPIRGHQPQVVTAGVATAERVVGSRAWGEQLADEHGILAVEMEGAAIAQACRERDVPFLAIRAISDVIGRRWQWLTMIRYLVPAQRNAERLVFALTQYLDEDR